MITSPNNTTFKEVPASHDFTNVFTKSSFKSPWKWLVETIRGLFYEFLYFKTKVKLPDGIFEETLVDSNFFTENPTARKVLPEERSSSESEESDFDLEFSEIDKDETFSPKQTAEADWINPLKTNTMLGPTPVRKFFDVLCEEKKVAYTDRFLFEVGKEDSLEKQRKSIEKELEKFNSQEFKPENGLVFIPVVFSKSGLPFSRDHIVLITVDLNKKRIEYFDSFGISVNDRKETLRNADQCSIKEMIKIVGDVYFPSEEFFFRENTSQHQQDFHSCGVYVMDRANKIADQKKLSKKISPDPLTTEDANQEARVKILTLIFNWVKKGPTKEEQDRRLA